MKIYTITVGYVPARIWEKSIQRYQETRHGGLNYEHIFIDQHYPLNQVENSEALRAINIKSGVQTIDLGRNLGLHGGFNAALMGVPLQPEDVVIGYDPDSYPENSGWDMALVTALLDPKIAWASLMAPWLDEPMKHRNLKKRFVNQVEVWIQPEPIMNSICAWKGDYLLKVGGLYEKSKWYGGLEVCMWDSLVKNNYEWAFLPGWRENHSLHWEQDELYKVWKWRLAHERVTTDDFETWLQKTASQDPEAIKAGIPETFK